jgi:hypothetical protein
MRIRLEDFVAETFSSYLGTSFCFRCPERPEGFLRLKLREVHPASGPAGPLPVRRGGFFSLLFEAEVETQSVGDLYQIEHPDFEPSTVLISRVSVPGRGPEDAALFEAVFG